MHVYLARRGLKLWNGKARIAQFIPIGEGLFSFNTADDELAKQLETHPFYKGELTKPDSIALKIPSIKEKVMIERAVVKDKDGKEINMPVEILVPTAVDSFYKTTSGTQVSGVNSKINAGPMTSVNSVQSGIDDKTEVPAELTARLEELKLKVLTKNGKIKVGASSEEIEEYFKTKGKLE